MLLVTILLFNFFVLFLSNSLKVSFHIFFLAPALSSWWDDVYDASDVNKPMSNVQRTADDVKKRLSFSPPRGKLSTWFCDNGLIHIPFCYWITVQAQGKLNCDSSLFSYNYKLWCKVSLHLFISKLNRFFVFLFCYASRYRYCFFYPSIRECISRQNWKQNHCNLQLGCTHSCRR